MQTLVIGGGGFVGARLVDRLVRRDWVEDVVVLDDGSGADLDELADLPVRTVVGSVLDRDLLDGLVGRADAVVHLAARWGHGAGLADPLGVHDVNATGTTRVLESATRNGVAHLVVGGWLDAETSPATDPLAASFAAAAAAVAGYRSGFGLRLLELRLAEVVGAGRPVGHPRGGWLDAMVDAVVEDRPVPVHGDGRSARQVVDVRTVVDVIERALRGVVGSPTAIDVVAPSPTSELEVLAHLAARAGRTLEIEALDGGRFAGEVTPPAADVGRMAARFPTVAAHPVTDTVDDMLAERRPVVTL